jgi:hypothetical protein
VSQSTYSAWQHSEDDMTGSSIERHIVQAMPSASIKLSTSFRPDRAERDALFRYLQELVDGELAGWWINEAGGTELHLIDGTAFLLQDERIVRLR